MEAEMRKTNTASEAIVIAQNNQFRSEYAQISAASISIQARQTMGIPAKRTLYSRENRFIARRVRVATGG